MKQANLIDFEEILDARSLVDRAQDIVSELAKLSTEARIGAINEIRKAIHEVSPFKSEPVDCVQWIHSDEVAANDYNPNSVAPPAQAVAALRTDPSAIASIFGLSRRSVLRNLRLTRQESARLKSASLRAAWARRKAA